MKILQLIVDSSAFIKNAQIHDFSDKVYSVSGVLDEVKDAKTRRMLAVLPYHLIIQEPSKESTGDYRNLSAVDLRIIALTYQKYTEIKGKQSVTMESEPPKIIKTNKSAGRSLLPGFHLSKNKMTTKRNGNEISDDITSEVKALLTSMVVKCVIEEHAESSSSPEINASNVVDQTSDDEDWITPSNIEQINKRMKEQLSLKTSEEDVEVACMTTDFAIQNVLKRMKIPVVSVDGLMIKETRSYVLYCHCCHTIVTNVAAESCPKCGLDDLLQKIVAKSLKSGKVVYIMPKTPFVSRKKHTFYVPPLKGGKKGTNHAALAKKNKPATNKTQTGNSAAAEMFNVDFILSQSPFLQDEFCLRGKRRRRR